MQKQKQLKVYLKTGDADLYRNRSLAKFIKELSCELAQYQIQLDILTESMNISGILDADEKNFALKCSYENLICPHMEEVEPMK